MKHTKHKLLSSIATLFVCLAMFIGSTYAWFTDSASTGVNKIQAGNLDIEVSYKTKGSNGEIVWEPIQDATTLFSTDLWEPGHTEYVTLKVENKGTLALKYKVLVTPVTEAGGVNVNGNSFKLSDYLVFGTTSPSTTLVDYTRETVRAAVGDTTGLANVNLLKQETNLNPEGVQYITLAVFMPENIGNEANHKTGTTAPSIDLGIKVVATQFEKENDSFDNHYDAGAIEDSFYTVGSYYDYYPQVSASSGTVSVDPANNKLSGTSSTVIKATGKLNKDDTEETTLAKVSVPVGTLLDENTSELTVKVTPKDPESSTTTGTALVTEINNPNRETANFDVKVVGVSSSNTSDIDVEVFVGKGLANVKVYHNGALINGAAYNPVTGMVTFKTKTFSDYTVAYDAAVAAIGTKTYGSLELAFAAVKNGETITLLKKSSGNGIVVRSGSNFTVDFNNYTYVVDGATVGSSGTETNGFQLLKDSTLVFKNGKITSSKAKILLQNYSNLTLDNMYLDGENIQWNYVLSNNNGNVVIKDTTINAPNKVAFDVCRYSSYVGPHVKVEGNSVINGDVEISSSGAKEGAKHKLTVTGGTFNGNITKSDSPNFVGDIEGGTFSYDPSDFLGEGYSAVKNGKIYTVKKLENYAGSQKALEALIDSENEITINLGAGSYTLTSGKCQNKTVTIIGAGDKTSLNITQNDNLSYQNGATLVFENMTVLGQTYGNYGGMAHTSKVAYKNCTIQGKLTLYAQTEEFLNCVLENKDDYSIWTWGAKNVLFDHCTFNSGGKALLLYGGAGSSEAPTTVLNVVDCTFNDDNTLNTNKAAIEAGNDYGATYVLTVKNTTVNGFTINPDGISTGTNLWANKNSMDKDHLSVEIDGVKKY